jgi:hypothetical protein
MTESQAIELARNLAAECGVELDRLFVVRPHEGNPNAHHWALGGSSLELPMGWGWVFNLNDCGEQQILIAHNWRFSKPRD